MIGSSYGFAKLRNETVSCIMSVCTELGSSHTDFQEILYLNILLKSVKKIQVWFKLGRSKCTLH
jgi:hypothetical protein